MSNRRSRSVFIVSSHAQASRSRTPLARLQSSEWSRIDAWSTVSCEPCASIDISMTGERNPQQALTGHQRQMCMGMAISW